MVSEAVTRRRVSDVMVLETVKRRGIGHLKKRRVSSKDHVLRHQLGRLHTVALLNAEQVQQGGRVDTGVPPCGDGRPEPMRTHTCSVNVHCCVCVLRVLHRCT